MVIEINTCDGYNMDVVTRVMLVGSKCCSSIGFLFKKAVSDVEAVVKAVVKAVVMQSHTLQEG